MANIRTARRSGLVLRGGRNIRNTLWGGLTPAATSIAGSSGANLVNVTGASLLALRPWTVVRFHGYWSVNSDQVAATENYSVCWSSSTPSSSP